MKAHPSLIIYSFHDLQLFSSAEVRQPFSVTPLKNSPQPILCKSLTRQSAGLVTPFPALHRDTMWIERVLTMQPNRHGFRRKAIEPRMNARSKTNNPFPINKPTQENRTFMRGSGAYRNTSQIFDRLHGNGALHETCDSIFVGRSTWSPARPGDTRRLSARARSPRQ